MAGMNYNIQTTNVPYQSTTSTTNTSRIGAVNVSQQDTKKVEGSRLENVVSRSTDGDTVQISRDAVNKANASDDGSVMARVNNQDTNETSKIGDIRTESQSDSRSYIERTQNQNAVQTTTNDVTEADTRRAEEIRKAQLESLRSKDSSDKQQQVNSLAGYTANQVEQLYREGRISQQEYDTWMQNRQETLDKASQKSAQLANTSAALGVDSTNNKLDSLAIGVAFSGSSSDKIDASMRYDAMQNIRLAQEGLAANRQRNEERSLWHYQLQV